MAASHHLVCHRLHPMRNDADDPGLRVVFLGSCARRRLGRRWGAERRVGHRCLSEPSERVSMGGRSRPIAFSRSADRPGDVLVFPFLVGQKGAPGPVTDRYAGRPHPGCPNAGCPNANCPNAGRAHTGRLIGVFQQPTLRSGRASAMEKGPSLSGIADMSSDSRVILGVLPGVRHPEPYTRHLTLYYGEYGLVEPSVAECAGLVWIHPTPVSQSTSTHTLVLSPTTSTISVLTTW